MFRNWWPGWNGEKKGVIEPLQKPDMGISMKRKYDLVKPGQRFERLVDYYFWSLEDLKAELPFICERPQKDIGCINGRGEYYKGTANRGESGDLCEPWNSPYLTMVLDRDKINNLGNLTNNNFCRNPDGDVSPWCIAPNGEFDYCDIPKCSESGGQNEILLDDPNAIKCAADEFQCKTSPNECILSAYVCDGQRDCLNGADENSCDGHSGIEAYEKHAKVWIMLDNFQTTISIFNNTGEVRCGIP